MEDDSSGDGADGSSSSNEVGDEREICGGGWNGGSAASGNVNGWDCLRRGLGTATNQLYKVTLLGVFRVDETRIYVRGTTKHLKD